MKQFHFARIWLAIQFEWLRPLLLKKTELDKLTMIEFRSLARMFGYDISDMTDEEIIKGVTRAAKEFSKIGLSVSEAGEAFRRMALCVTT